MGDTSCLLYTSPVNKGFNFHILGNMLSDFSDFFQRQFSGSYHTFCSQPVPEPVGFIIGVVCLGTDAVSYTHLDVYKRQSL